MAYELPDGQLLQLDVFSRTRPMEILFNPKLLASAAASSSSAPAPPASSAAAAAAPSSPPAAVAAAAAASSPSPAAPSAASPGLYCFGLDCIGIEELVFFSGFMLVIVLPNNTELLMGESKSAVVPAPSPSPLSSGLLLPPPSPCCFS